jgi:hypothetical protein
VGARADSAFAQARLQARHGAMPDEHAWRALEASRTASHYVALARKGPLARWVDGIGDDADVHGVEYALRARWRRYVDEVARWQAPAWREATRWFGALAELPLAAGLLRGAARARAAWPDLPADADAAAKAVALRSAGLGPLAAASTEGGSQALAAAWLAEWNRRLPAGAAADPAIGHSAELLLPRLRDNGEGRSAGSELLRRALVKLFRRHAFSPAAVYAHLALVALDVERLRGGVTARRLASAARGEAA